MKEEKPAYDGGRQNWQHIVNRLLSPRWTTVMQASTLVIQSEIINAVILAGPANATLAGERLLGHLKTGCLRSTFPC